MFPHKKARGGRNAKTTKVNFQPKVNDIIVPVKNIEIKYINNGILSPIPNWKASA